ncbi:protein-glutamate O-methyltransferase family protein [Brucepastera parasyntrophica]|uniref:ARMT1-like domain-containing protein n=1 Tax=Brucepastera parasyntrophica TaxID=2880008 RepID=UPI00210BC98B|nr:ARMT1-like domain-containing protein [Brucepastera parasyntrophica]ULQ59769.1 protein-glutamate O-methyltransferase family protein [Brucepastera parasyntrophica]
MNSRVRDLADDRVNEDFADLFSQSAEYKDLTLKDFFAAAPFFLAEFYFYYILLKLTGYFSSKSDPFFPVKQSELHKLSEKEIDFEIEFSNSKKLRELIENTVTVNVQDLSRINKIQNHLSGFVIDDSDIIEKKLKTIHSRADIFCDNAGAELLQDLLRALIIIRNTNARVVLHLKPVPIFVSDATFEDFYNLLEHIPASIKKSIESYLKKDMLVRQTHKFWANPVNFRDMPEAYNADLNKSELLVIKGDLNYRRTVEDRYWKNTADINELTRYSSPEDAVLRVLKSDVLVSVSDEQYKKYMDLDNQFKTDGRWGLIQKFH